MQPKQASEQVAAIMGDNGVPFATSDDGLSHRIIAGLAGIFIRFVPSGDEDTIVSLAGFILVGVQDADTPTILATLNELNVNSFYGKFVFNDGTLGIEYDLLASDLREVGFMNALNVLASYANEYGDKLKADFGGKTYVEFENANEPEVTPEPAD